MQRHDGVLRRLEHGGLTRLPALPQILLKLLELFEIKGKKFEELSEVLSKDPVLSARVVAAASTAFADRKEHLIDLESALEALGHDTAKGIVVSAAISQAFPGPGAINPAALRAYWQHSVACAIAARELAERTNYVSPDEAYFSGLVHDIGRLVLAAKTATAADAAFLAYPDSRRLVELEQERFGANHCALGAALVDGWQLLSFIADAVRYHHEPVSSLLDAHQLVKIVHLSNRVSRRREEQWDDVLYQADAFFGMSSGEVSELADRVAADVERAAGALDIHLAPGTPHIGLVAEQVKHDLLRKKVLNLAVLEGLDRDLNGASREDRVLRVVQEWLTILLDTPSALVFLHDAEDGVLVGSSQTGGRRLIGGLRIPLQEGRSLVSDALVTRKISSTYGPGARRSLSVIDRQILGLSGRNGMTCVPMTTDRNIIGVIVLGLDEADLPATERRLDLIKAFAVRAARAIHACRRRAEKARRTESESRRRIEVAIRQIVHEAGNPLSIINNYLELLETRLDREHPAREDLKIIREETDRVHSIVLRLSDIPKMEELGLELVSVGEVISEVLRVFQGSLFALRQIEADVALEEGIPPIVSSRESIKEVLTNLIRNAVEAMPSSGKVSIKTRDKVVLDGDMYVEITVADTGPGIPREILAKLFSPVASTKGEGHAGLGLTIVRDRLKELGGYISCKTQERIGTTFTILLPRITSSEQ